jgi:hypothetical protein
MRLGLKLSAHFKSYRVPLASGWRENVGKPASSIAHRVNRTGSSALASLTRGERTGSRIFWQIWSYVLIENQNLLYMGDDAT